MVARCESVSVDQLWPVVLDRIAQATARSGQLGYNVAETILRRIRSDEMSAKQTNALLWRIASSINSCVNSVVQEAARLVSNQECELVERLQAWSIADLLGTTLREASLALELGRIAVANTRGSEIAEGLLAHARLRLKFDACQNIRDDLYEIATSVRQAITYFG
jgi:hypothetical protein